MFDILLSEKFVSYDAFPVEHLAYVSECSQDIEPTRFEEAAMENQWMSAMSEEVNAMHKNKTWELVPPPSDKHVVGCKLVYKIKLKSDRSVDRFKARLVAKGTGIDYEEALRGKCICNNRRDLWISKSPTMFANSGKQLLVSNKHPTYTRGSKELD